MVSDKAWHTWTYECLLAVNKLSKSQLIGLLSWHRFVDFQLLAFCWLLDDLFNFLMDGFWLLAYCWLLDDFFSLVLLFAGFLLASRCPF